MSFKIPIRLTCVHKMIYWCLLIWYPNWDDTFFPYNEVRHVSCSVYLVKSEKSSNNKNQYFSEVLKDINWSVILQSLGCKSVRSIHVMWGELGSQLVPDETLDGAIVHVLAKSLAWLFHQKCIPYLTLVVLNQVPW